MAAYMSVVILCLPLILSQVYGSLDTETSGSLLDKLQEAKDAAKHVSSNDGNISCNIGLAEAILTSPVILARRKEHIHQLGFHQFSFFVDSTITVMLVEVLGHVKKSTARLNDPTGKAFVVDGKNFTIPVDCPSAYIYQVANPKPGKWQLRFNDSRSYEMIIKANSLVTFSASFLRPVPPDPNPLPVEGIPPAGLNLTLKVELFMSNLINNITTASVTRASDERFLEKYSLTEVHHNNIYMSTIQLPEMPVHIGISGTDKNNNRLERISNTTVTAYNNITLILNQTHGWVYNTSSAHLPFFVVNKGEQDTFHMSGSAQSKDMTVVVKQKTFNLQGGASFSGMYVVSTKEQYGDSGYVTLTAKGVNSGFSESTKIWVVLIPPPSQAGTASFPCLLMLLSCIVLSLL